MGDFSQRFFENCTMIKIQPNLLRKLQVGQTQKIPELYAHNGWTNFGCKIAY